MIPLPHSTMHHWNLNNQRVLLRIDANVSFNNGIMVDELKLEAVAPTIEYLLSCNAHIIILTHIGRPEKNDPELSTKKLLPWFNKKKHTTSFAPTVNDIDQTIHPRHITVLENLRFFPQEDAQDVQFAQQLAQLGSFYVNDASASLHRNATSLVLLAEQFDRAHKSVGFLVQKELQELQTVLNTIIHPFVAIIGGKKAKTKIPLFIPLFTIADAILVCPALSFTFHAAQNIPVGNSFVEQDQYETCNKTVAYAQKHDKALVLPTDYQVAQTNVPGSLIDKKVTDITQEDLGIAIGKRTMETYKNIIASAGTIFLNGVMGFADRPNTQSRSTQLLQAIAESHAITIVCGGDTTAHISKTPYKNSITHTLTGGGSTLALLAGQKIESIEALEK